MNDTFWKNPAIAERLVAIEKDLQEILQVVDRGACPGLFEMIAYHLGWGGSSQQQGGKRIRPLLTLLCCEAAGGDWHVALAAASCLELIHNFSLVHDDIEDQSEERRGRHTLWKRWGIAQAINTGDALFAVSRLAGHRLSVQGLPVQVTLRAMRLCDEAVVHLSCGQYLDLEFETASSISESAYLRMIAGKTAALIAAATEVGAEIAQAPPKSVSAFRAFGHHLGLAFQMRDDLLGIWGQQEATGKPIHDDLSRRKKTLPVIYGLQHAPAFSKLWARDKTDKAATVAMRSALEDAGVPQYVRQLAAQHSEQALSALAEANPKHAAAAHLETFTHLLLNRQA
jgi:geranylgeranyl diphosphate synthase type I